MRLEPRLGYETEERRADSALSELLSSHHTGPRNLKKQNLKGVAILEWTLKNRYQYEEMG